MAPFRPRGRLRRRPNFLIVMMDEQRAAPFYESPELQAWRLANLPTQNLLRRNSFEFTHHHVMSVACQPSRASIYTGQYPSLHGIAQTSGAAKTAIEQDLFWLDPTTVPTLGLVVPHGGLRHVLEGQVAHLRCRPLPAGQLQPASVVQRRRRSRPAPRGRLPRVRATGEVRLHRLHRPGAARQQPAELRLLRVPAARAATRCSPSSASSSCSGCAEPTTRGCSSRRSSTRTTSRCGAASPLAGDLSGAQGSFYLAEQLVGSQRAARPVRPRLHAVDERGPQHQARGPEELRLAVPRGLPAAAQRLATTTASTTSCRRTSTSRSAR